MHRPLAVVCRQLAGILAVAGWLAAIPRPLVAADPPPIRVEVLAGNDSVNSLTTPNVIVPKVRVRDAAGNPIMGVKTHFELPDAIHGYFSGRVTGIDRETDGRGEATAPGYVPSKAGAFTIKVTATLQGQTAVAQIRQRNGNQPYAVFQQSRGGRKWIWIAAGAATGGVLAAVFRPKSTPTATVSLGAPTVGGR